VALHNIRGIQGDLELLTDLCDTLCLMLAAAIGEKDESNALFLQQGQRVCGTGDRFRRSKEDAIDAMQ
jgi:hypothetical protein